MKHLQKMAERFFCFTFLLVTCACMPLSRTISHCSWQVACEATLIGMAKVARKFSYKRRCQVSLPAPKRHSQQEAWATPAVNARSCRNPTPQSGFPGEDLEISPLKFDVEACKTWTCKGSTAGRDGR